MQPGEGIDDARCAQVSRYGRRRHPGINNKCAQRIVPAKRYCIGGNVMFAEKHWTIDCLFMNSNRNDNQEELEDKYVCL
jgi:hypothetical protein